MGNAVLDLCAFVVREGWEHREDEGDYPRSLAQKALAEADALRAHAKKVEYQRDTARADERAAIVAWLRENRGDGSKMVGYTEVIDAVADAIEHGEHEVKKP